MPAPKVSLTRLFRGRYPAMAVKREWLKTGPKRAKTGNSVPGVKSYRGQNADFRGQTKCFATGT